MADWYDRIEEPVRELVRVLRNNGFNTVCSCGHDLYVQMAWDGYDEETRDLYNLLHENGYTKFTLQSCWPSDEIGRFMTLTLTTEYC